MTDPTPSPVASAVSAVKSAAHAEVVAAESKLKAFVSKYWPIAAALAIAATRFVKL